MTNLTQRHGAILIAEVRETLARSLGCTTTGIMPALAQADRAWLQQPGAVFVTLMSGECLRGCIGSVRAHRPLIDDVRGHAMNAAFGDPRFPSVNAEELATIEIEVSLLSALEEMRFADEREALSLLRRDVDGIVLDWRSRSATFLPQVWQQLPTPDRFLNGLKEKAGLDASFWSDDLRLQRFSALEWHESELPAADPGPESSLPRPR